MFLEQFVNCCMYKRYLNAIEMMYFLYISYNQSWQKLGTNVQKHIVTSNKRKVGGIE